MQPEQKTPRLGKSSFSSPTRHGLRTGNGRRCRQLGLLGLPEPNITLCNSYSCVCSPREIANQRPKISEGSFQTVRVIQCFSLYYILLNNLHSLFSLCWRLFPGQLGGPLRRLPPVLMLFGNPSQDAFMIKKTHDGMLLSALGAMDEMREPGRVEKNEVFRV